MDITIPKAEYDTLLSIKAKAETLEEKVKSLEADTQNKSVAIEEARKKTDEAKKQFKTDLENLEAQNKKLLQSIGIAEGENPETIISTLIEKSKNFDQIQEKTKQERIAKIDGYKKTLGEEFLKSKANLFDGLSEEKQELLLSEYVSAISKDKGNPPKVDISNFGNGKDSQETSNFDKLLASGANSKDLIASLE